MKGSGLIFDIRRYSINDGPGIRVTVFFKGCPLRCRWCHNPESQSETIEKLYSRSRCIGCLQCIEACKSGALSSDPLKGIVTDLEKCVLCGRCAEVCPSHAMEMSGKSYTVEQIMKEIRKESITMDQSGGGVTFSGGEPLMHPEMLIPLLEACGKEGFHRAVDTAGHSKPEILMNVARNTDLFLYDLKHMDSKIHKEYTGVTNELILDNLRLLAGTGKEIKIRIPLAEGFNADEANIVKTAKFIATLPLNAREVNLLPFHSIAFRKYEKLGRECGCDTLKEPGPEKTHQILELFRSSGISATTGG